MLLGDILDLGSEVGDHLGQLLVKNQESLIRLSPCLKLWVSRKSTHGSLEVVSRSGLRDLELEVRREKRSLGKLAELHHKGLDAIWHGQNYLTKHHWEIEV